MASLPEAPRAPPVGERRLFAVLLDLGSKGIERAEGALRALLVLDVRTLLETHDGALVYVSYRGRLDLSGGPGATPSYAAPLFDTGDERYAWLNAIQAVAKGTLSDGGATITYEVHELR